MNHTTTVLVTTVLVGVMVLTALQAGATQESGATLWASTPSVSCLPKRDMQGLRKPEPPPIGVLSRIKGTNVLLSRGNKACCLEHRTLPGKEVFFAESQDLEWR